MRFVSKALVVAGLATLAACGGNAEENAATANVGGEDIYNVAPDDLGAENLLGNDSLGNEVGLDNEAVANDSANTDTADTAANAQ